jgi:hypothetical protein
VKFEPQRAQRTQREVATNSVLSVYSVAKEMIIMKMRCFSSEIRAIKSTEGTVQLTVIFKMLDDNESV